jgi:hypothetical protein
MNTPSSIEARVKSRKKNDKHKQKMEGSRLYKEEKQLNDRQKVVVVEKVVYLQKLFKDVPSLPTTDSQKLRMRLDVLRDILIPHLHERNWKRLKHGEVAKKGEIEK